MKGRRQLLQAKKSLTQTRHCKEQVESILERDVQAIVEGRAGAHYKNCLPILDSLGLDDSLITALPSACVKPPAERGPFDTMVVTQLETSFSNKVASLTSALVEEEAAHQARVAALEAASTHLTESKDVLRRAQDVLGAMQCKEREAIDALKAAQAAIEQYEPEYKRTTEVRDARGEALNHFRHYNLGSFKMLCDGAATTTAVTEALPEPIAQGEKNEMILQNAQGTRSVVVAGA